MLVAFLTGSRLTLLLSDRGKSWGQKWMFQTHVLMEKGRRRLEVSLLDQGELVADRRPTGQLLLGHVGLLSIFYVGAQPDRCSAGGMTL